MREISTLPNIFECFINHYHGKSKKNQEIGNQVKMVKGNQMTSITMKIIINNNQNKQERT